MKQPKISDLVMDGKGTKRIRSEAAKTKKVKITINIDHDSLEAIQALASNTGGSYQKLLNQVLRDGLKRRTDSESRLDRIERELERLKKGRAA